MVKRVLPQHTHKTLFLLSDIDPLYCASAWPAAGASGNGSTEGDDRRLHPCLGSSFPNSQPINRLVGVQAATLILRPSSKLHSISVHTFSAILQSSWPEPP